MRRLLLAFSLLVATLASGIVAAPAIAADTASISGVVYGEGTPNVTLPGAQVLVSRVGGGFSSGFPAASNGSWSLGGLAAGSYTVRFSVPGSNWVAEAWNNQSLFTGTPITVTEGQAVTGIDPVLTYGASIHGTVTGGSAPIDGGRVFLTTTSGDSYFAYTGSDGAYVLGGVPAGSYTLKFEPLTGDTTFAAEFWNNASTEAAATPVTLAVGSGTQFDADLPYGTTVSGRVQGSDNGMYNVNSAIVTLVNTTTRATFSATALNDGTYTVPSVPPGTYAVKFDQSAISAMWATAWLGLHPSFATSTRVTVTAGTPVTGVDIVLPRGASVNGTVLNDYELSIGGTAVVYEAGLAGDSLDSYVGRGYASSGGGQYTVSNLLPGSYKLGFSTDTLGYNPTTGALQPSANSQAPWSGRTASYSAAPTIALTEREEKTGVDGRFTVPRFADVPTASQFYPQVQWMYVRGISVGTAQPSGLPLYNPSSTVSRQAMAQFLMRMADPQDFDPPAEPTFADVPTSHPFYRAVEWMASEGISLGTTQPSGKPLFKPGDPVSRQSMAVFLARYASAATPAPSTPSFADVPITANTAGAIQWMATSGISTGTAQPSGLPLYKPVDPVSRQAMAAFLNRLSHLLDQ